MKKSLFGIILLGAVLILGFDRREEREEKSISQSAKGISVVTTAFYQYDFARQVLGREENCCLIVPPGRKAVSYIPTPNDEEKIAQADIFIYNGDESWACRYLEENPQIKSIRVLDYVKKIRHTCGKECICISPGNAKKVLKVVSGEMQKLDADNAVFYEANMKNYMVQIDALNPETALYSCSDIGQTEFLEGQTYVSLLSSDTKRK